MNHVPGRYAGKLATPHMLVHGVRGNARYWAPLFSVCYFHHAWDTITGKLVKRSKSQAHAVDGIVVGRSDTSNAPIVYNPRNKKFYDEVQSFRVDSHRLPGAVYAKSGITYNGGLFCHLKRDGSPPQDEQFSPGTRVEEEDPRTKVLHKGTVTDIPIDPAQPDSELHYMVVFDNGVSRSVPLIDMVDMVLKPPASPVEQSQDRGIPEFYQVGRKITYEYEGQYHKGYMGIRGGARTPSSFVDIPTRSQSSGGLTSRTLQPPGAACRSTVHCSRDTRRPPSSADSPTRSPALSAR